MLYLPVHAYELSRYDAVTAGANVPTFLPSTRSLLWRIALFEEFLLLFGASGWWSHRTVVLLRNLCVESDKMDALDSVM